VLIDMLRIMSLFRNIRYYPLLLVAALFFNAAMPFFTVNSASSRVMMPALTSLFGDKILICAGNSFKWVTLAALQSGKEKPKPHSDQKCQHCHAARSGFKDALLPVIAMLGDSHHGRSPASALLIEALAIYQLKSPAYPRAPPVFSAV
jgi:hypothetical protein